MATEVRFIGPEYDGAEQELGKLADKLRNLADNAALERFGKGFLDSPTDIEVLPTTTTDLGETKFILAAWHETAAPPGRVGVLQKHDTSFGISIEGEDAFMRTEQEYSHPLTSRELLLLMGLANIAIVRSLLTSYPEEDS